MSPEHERLLHADFVAGLTSRSIEEVRSMRAECVAAETGLSYLRRMVQGPLDIVSAELKRRAAGQGTADLAAVVESLPTTLADQTRSPGVGRLPQTLEPTELDPELDAELQRLVGNAQVSNVGELHTIDLIDLAEQLKSFEQKVSERRKRFFDAIDALQAELTRRYQTGEASVDALLNG
jgi:hypothetical protein